MKKLLVVVAVVVVSFASTGCVPDRPLTPEQAKRKAALEKKCTRQEEEKEWKKEWKKHREKERR